MGRKPTKDNGVTYEPLKARVTNTDNGFPADLFTVRDAYGSSVMAAPEQGWFWIFATPRAAADIRRRGLRAIGKETTTWIPPQSRPVAQDVDPETVPVLGSVEHAEAMVAECELPLETRYPTLDEKALALVPEPGPGHFEAEAPEATGSIEKSEKQKPGPLRKVIIFRLRPTQPTDFRKTDPFPLLEEIADPRELPTLEQWLDAGSPVREI